MLNEVQFSEYVDALVQMEILEVTVGEDSTEWIKLKVPLERLLLDAIEYGYTEPPGDVKFLPWVSIILARTIIEQRETIFSNDELAGIASVILGLLVESGCSELDAKYRQLAQYERTGRKVNK